MHCHKYHSCEAANDKGAGATRRLVEALAEGRARCMSPRDNWRFSVNTKVRRLLDGSCRRSGMRSPVRLRHVIR